MNKEYNKLVQRAALLAVITAILLVIIKGFAWWKTGSVSMLAAITDSLLDLFASGTSMIILRFALMPADDDHSFGHGKAESLASLAQSAFIAGSALFLLLNGIERLSSPRPLHDEALGLVVTVVVIIFTLLLTGFQSYVIKKTDSPAIKADRLHYQTDLYMNITILISLALTAWGFLYADSLFAIAIALYILYSAAVMFYEAVQLLLDRSLPEEEVDKIKSLANNLPGSLGFHDLRTRRSGGTRFIQLHLEFPQHLPLNEVHDISDVLEEELKKEFPGADVIIHQDPYNVVK